MNRSFSQASWEALAQRFPFGTTVHGTVLHVARFGVFVQVDEFPDVKALLEIVHMPHAEQHPFRPLVFPDDYPPVGTRIEAQILGWQQQPGEVRLTQLSYS